jgi:hypothetical protein
MHARQVSRRYGAAAIAAPAPQAFGLGRTAVLAAMVALLALALVRPTAGANQSGPTVSEISWALSGLCRALGGIDEVTPTRDVGGLLNVYFKCKGGYLGGLDCKIGDAGDPTKGSCTFKSALAPRQWATISQITNGAVHDLVSVNGLVQGASPAQWATVSQIASGAIGNLTPANALKVGAGDDGSDSDRDATKVGTSKDGHRKGGHGNGKQRNRP